ncbi:hypothetical protein [Desulfotignum balticum]|jgi:hypothetical protein|uniref:hypothetical protein n=1 Tax=Desulfotignum balticum TaxID=115781 RepID=UPI0004625B1B|nr:hypothetical protein [Desulfotignum balticum]
MIHVSQKKLDNSYRHLKQECLKNSAGSNARLLLFVYAIECGVKALLLKRKHLTDTYKLSMNEGNNKLSHDLRKLLSSLNYPFFQHFPENIKFLIRSKNPEAVPHKELHQALRYGGTFSNPVEKNGLEIKLTKIDSWLQEELTR